MKHKVHHQQSHDQTIVIPKRYTMRYILPSISIMAVIVISLLLLLKNEQTKVLAPEQHTSLTAQELQDRVNSLGASGKYDEARRLLEGNTSKEGQLLTGQVLMSEQKYFDALQKYFAVEQQYGIDKQVASVIAQAAELAGNKNLAIEYYHKVIEFTQAETNNPVRGREIETLNAVIDRLMGNK